jgi:hypothetical protein
VLTVKAVFKYGSAQELKAITLRLRINGTSEFLFCIIEYDWRPC